MLAPMVSAVVLLFHAKMQLTELLPEGNIQVDQ
jgi:hypothetical protein